MELSPQPFIVGLIKAKLNFEGQFSREFVVLCAMIAQNAYFNGGAKNQRQRGGTRKRKTAWGEGAIDFGVVIGANQLQCAARRQSAEAN